MTLFIITKNVSIIIIIIQGRPKNIQF